MSKFSKDVKESVKRGEVKLVEIDNKVNEKEVEISNKSRLVTFLLCYIFGMFGAHRFYVGKKGTAVIYILTMGLFGIGLLVDTLKIILGKFRDVEDNLITKWITED
jgi:TM2 domain-containing membrane protein YozV